MYALLLKCLCLFLLNRQCESKPQKAYVLNLERFDTKCNPDYLINCSSALKKYNRTSPRTLNFESYLIKPLGKNVIVNLKSYEWKDNQYKESFITLDIPICDMLLKDKWLMPAVRRYANVPMQCPFPAGSLWVRELYPDTDTFPDSFPISKWKFSFTFFLGPTRKAVLLFIVHFSAERNKYYKIKKKG